MTEINNDFFFKQFFEKSPLDEVMEGLEITRIYNSSFPFNPDFPLVAPLIPLTAELYAAKIIKDVDPFMAAVAKTSTLFDFYQEHSKDCDEAIARWNTGK